MMASSALTFVLTAALFLVTAVAEIVVRERRLIDLALDPFRNVGG